MTQITDSLTPTARTTSFTYDGNNSNITYGDVTNVAFTALLAGSQQTATTSYGYGNYHEVNSITDPLNHTSNITIDSAGNATAFADPDNRTWTAGYNGAGQVNSVSDPLNNTTHFGYAAPTGDLASVTDPLNNSSSFTTDTVGRVIATTTPLRETASYAYDAMNHVTQATDPNGKSGSYTYDYVGHLTKLTDPLNHATTWTWTPPSGSTWDVQECDARSSCIEALLDWASGLPQHVTDKRGLTTTFTYDPHQRVITTTFNTNSIPNFYQTTINYTYDTADRATQMVDTGGGTPNSAGNTQTSRTMNGTTSLRRPTFHPRTTPSTASSTLRGIRPPCSSQAGTDQPTVNYTLDSADYLTAVSNGTLSASPIQYDGAGRRSCTTLPNGVIVSYGYDADSRISSITYGTGGSCASPPSNLGNLTYTYDADGRIIGKGGSLAAVNLPSAVTGNPINNANQVLSWNGTNATIDAANNLKTDPVNSNTYDWNERNAMSHVSYPNYQTFYDALGRRETFDQLGVISSYAYDSAMAVQAASNSTQNSFTTPDGEVLRRHHHRLNHHDRSAAGGHSRLGHRAGEFERQPGDDLHLRTVRQAEHERPISASIRICSPRWNTIRPPGSTIRWPATTARPSSASSPKIRSASGAAISICSATRGTTRSTPPIPWVSTICPEEM